MANSAIDLSAFAAVSVGQWELQETIDASAMVAVDIDIDAGYDHYWVMVRLVPATDAADPYIRTGTSGGIDSGASDYEWQRAAQSSTTPSAGEDTADPAIIVVGSVGNATTEGVWINFTFRPTDGTRYSEVLGIFTWWNTSGNMGVGIISGARKDTTAVTTLRLLFSSGNIAIAKGAVYRAVGA